MFISSPISRIHFRRGLSLPIRKHWASCEKSVLQKTFQLVNNLPKYDNMFIDQKYFDSWMNRLTSQIEKLNRKIDRQDDSITPKIGDEVLLDNQDLCLLLKVSQRTLQRFRSSGKLPYRLIGRKVYYLESDVTNFIHKGYKNL